MLCLAGCLIVVVFVVALDVIINRSMDGTSTQNAVVSGAVAEQHKGATHTADELNARPTALHNNNKKLDVSGRVHSHQVKHVKNGHVMPFADHAFPVHTFGIELEMGLKDLSLTLTRKSAVTLFSPKQTRPDPYSKPDPTRQYKLPNYNPSLHGNQSLNSPQP